MTCQPIQGCPLTQRRRILEEEEEWPLVWKGSKWLPMSELKPPIFTYRVFYGGQKPPIFTYRVFYGGQKPPIFTYRVFYGGLVDSVPSLQHELCLGRRQHCEHTDRKLLVQLACCHIEITGIVDNYSCHLLLFCQLLVWSFAVVVL